MKQNREGATVQKYAFSVVRTAGRALRSLGSYVGIMPPVGSDLTRVLYEEHERAVRLAGNPNGIRVEKDCTVLEEAEQIRWYNELISRGKR